MRTIRTFAALAALSLPIAGACAQSDTEAETESEREWPSYVYVNMSTNQGDIVLELNHDLAPKSVENFVQYVEDDAYDGTVFHRVMSGFMIQGGGFTPDGAKVPTREPIPNEWQNGLKNTKGTIAMARLGGQANSATNQFFINVADNGFLDSPRDGSAYAVFGEVIEGMDVVTTIEGVQIEQRGMQQHWPVKPVIIEEAEIASDEETEKYLESRAAIHEEREPEYERLAQEMRERQEAEEQARREAEAADKQAWEDALAQAKELIAGMGHDVSEGYIDEETGIWTLILETGNDTRPEPTDRIRAHYTGWFPDGTKFDSSRDRGTPMEHNANGFISGWNETLVKMGEGGRRFLVIPYQKAYGANGRRGIPPKSILIFDMELIKVL